MKKAIIFALVAFLVSAGGTTAFMVKTHKAVPVADSLAVKGDSVAPVPVAADKPKVDSLRPDSAHAGAPGDSVSVVRDSGVAVTPAVAAPLAPAVQAAAHRASEIDPVAKAAAFKQVARVLSAMKPIEAAKVLGFLSDDEVEGLLRAVGPRQAADFLTNIPKERAAGLSRRLLVPKAPAR